MAALVKHLDQNLITSYLLPLLKALLSDKNDSVKVHAVQSSVIVAKLMEDPETIAANLIPPLKQAFTNKQSWRLRFAVAENAATIGQQIEKSSVDQHILPLYVTLLGDSEPEVRSEAVNRLSELAQNCSPNLIVSNMLPRLKL